MNLTNAHSANTVDLAAPCEPSQSRYTHYYQGTLPGTAGRSLQGFLDRWRSLCSLVWSTAGMLQRNSVICSGTTIVLNIQSLPHLACVCLIHILDDLKYFKSFLNRFNAFRYENDTQTLKFQIYFAFRRVRKAAERLCNCQYFFHFQRAPCFNYLPQRWKYRCSS